MKINAKIASNILATIIPIKELLHEVNWSNPNLNLNISQINDRFKLGLGLGFGQFTSGIEWDWYIDKEILFNLGQLKLTLVFLIAQ